jgi:2,4-diketo-3-deoxy-L-fuconate hydrolase
VTRDEIVDPQALQLRCEVSGRIAQDSNTSDMIFSVAEAISYLSSFMSLEPGDLICTGTPQGVGHGSKPPIYLKDGDVMVLSIEGLGEQRQLALAERE